MGPHANRVREIREYRRRDLPTLFTTSALACRLHVNPSTLRRWEAGSVVPTPRHVRALARELGVSVEDLGYATDPAEELAAHLRNQIPPAPPDLADIRTAVSPHSLRRP